MRVTILIDSVGQGGAERSTTILLDRLPQLGVTPHLVCLRSAAEGDTDRILAAGHELSILQSTSPLARTAELHRLIGRTKPNVIHTALFNSDLVGRLAGLISRTPVLSSLVNTPYEPTRLNDPRVRPARFRAARLLDSWTARHMTDHFHAVTEGVANSAVRYLRIDPDRISVVHRGRDPYGTGFCTAERRKYGRALANVADDEVMVLAVGRQEWQKGHDVLARAIAELREWGVPVRAVVAGRDGNLTNTLSKLRESLGITECFELAGYSEEVATLLCAADLFVMPSRYEGAAGSALEAMAMKTPIVASDLPGSADVLPTTVARLVVPDDPAALAHAIQDSLADEQATREQVKRASEHFELNFSMDDYAHGMAELYRTVVVESRERA